MQKTKKISEQREKELKELFGLLWDRNERNCRKEFQSKDNYVAYRLADAKGLSRIYSHKAEV